jgi:hypothetical protein
VAFLGSVEQAREVLLGFTDPFGDDLFVILML